MNKSWLSLILFLCLLLVACSNEASKEPVNPKNESKQENLTIEDKERVTLLTSERTVPSNYDPSLDSMIYKVDNQKSYEEIWELYRFEQSISKANFEKNDIYFISLYESSSCPYELDKTKMNIDNQVMNIHLSEPDGPCTLDASPRTLVVEVSKESSNAVNNIAISTRDGETTFPINEL